MERSSMSRSADFSGGYNQASNFSSSSALRSSWESFRNSFAIHFSCHFLGDLPPFSARSSLGNQTGHSGGNQSGANLEARTVGVRDRTCTNRSVECKMRAGEAWVRI